MRRNIAITVFVVAWSLLFFYQTFRASYLAPWAKRMFQVELPVIQLLFPPAGWIMFYRVDPSSGRAEIYGVRNDSMEEIDPHKILKTRAIGYDNIRRNVLIGALYGDRSRDFCRFLVSRFSEYDSFMVVYAQFPDLLNEPDRIIRQLAYRCP